MSIVVIGLNAIVYISFFKTSSQTLQGVNFYGVFQAPSSQNDVFAQNIVGIKPSDLPTIAGTSLSKDYKNSIKDQIPQIVKNPTPTDSTSTDSSQDPSTDSTTPDGNDNNGNPLKADVLNTVSVASGTYKETNVVTWQYNSRKIIVQKIVDNDFSNDKNTTQTYELSASYNPGVSWCEMAENGSEVLDVAFYADYAIQASCQQYTGGWLYKSNKKLSADATNAREEIKKLCAASPKGVCDDIKKL